MEFNIQWKPSPNYKIGRNGYKIIGICNHQTAGQFPGCLSWMCNPNAKASAQYLVTRKGQIFQLVRDQDTSYHAGIVNKPSWSLYSGHNPNYDLIGIEHECYPSVGGDGNLTEIQYQATLWLHKQLIDKYNIPIDRDRLIGHYQIDSKNRPNCPGKSFPWDRLINDLTQEDNTSYFKALDTLVFDKVISSPDYWKNCAINNTDVKGEYMATVIQKMTNTNNLISGVSYLVNKGVISSPNYWLINCVIGKTVDINYVKKVIVDGVSKLGL